MSRLRRARALPIFAAAALLLCVGVAGAHFEDRSNNPQTADAVPDFLPPTVSASVIQKSTGGVAGYVGTNANYRAYASITDSGNPSSGIATATADLSAISNAAGAVPMTAGSWTVAGTAYNYRTAPMAVAGSTTNGSKNYSISAGDNAGHSDTTGGFTVTVDNNAPAGTNFRAENTGGGQAGEAGTGDTATFSYSEPIDPQSILAGWDGAPTSVSLTIKGTQNSPGAGSELTVAVGGTPIGIGAVDLVGSYTHPKNRDVTFTGSTMVRTGSTIVITLGTPDSDRVRTESNSVSPQWAPSSAGYDRAGNPINTATVTGTNAVQF